MTVKETTITEGHVSEKLETRDLVLIAQCAAMMTVCSWISVPAAVPFTMQTFGVFMAIGLLEVVGLLYGELAIVKAAIVLVLEDASVGQFPVLRFVIMPGEEEVASTTGMTAANGLILTRRRLAAPDLRPLEHALVEILVARMAIIDMVLFRICASINAIVAAVQSTIIGLVQV